MASNPARYIVEIDTQRDGQYAGALDDVTEFVVNAQWSNGFRTPYQDVAPPNQLRFTLNNADGRFDVDRDTALYADVMTPSTLVRVFMEVGTTRAQMWEGRINQVEPIVGKKRERPFVEVRCVDLMADLARFEYFPALLQNVRVDEALGALFESAPVAYPYDSFGGLGYMKLGVDSFLYNENEITDFETALSTINFAGALDVNARKVTATMYLADCVQHECGGRVFYQARNHKFTFHNRHHDLSLVGDPVDATFDGDELDNVRTSYGDDIASRIVYEWSPRYVGSAGSTLYQAENVPFTIRADSTRRISARFSDPDNDDARVNAETVISPVLGSDIVSDNNSGLSVATEIKANAVIFEITNTTASDIEITTLRVRGTPLYEFETETIELIDTDAVQSIGKVSRSFRKRVQNQSDAEQHAQFLLNSFKTPKRRVDSMQYIVRNAKRAEHARDLTVGSLVLLDDSANSGHRAKYVIIGESHSVQGQLHTVNYTVQLADRIAGAVLGVEGFGELGINTYLVF